MAFKSNTTNAVTNATIEVQGDDPPVMWSIRFTRWGGECSLGEAVKTIVDAIAQHSYDDEKPTVAEKLLAVSECLRLLGEGCFCTDVRSELFTGYQRFKAMIAELTDGQIDMELVPEDTEE